MGVRTQEVSAARGNLPGGGTRRGGRGSLFGVPMGDLGWFTSLLMAAATGFAAFFAATFVGIVGIMVYNSTGRAALDYAYSYTRLGLPVGLFVMVVALGYLGMLWTRRVLGRR